MNVQDWMAAGQFGASFLTLLTTVVIAGVAHRFSRRVTTIQTEREIASHLMQLNLAIYSNKEVAEHFQRTRHPSQDLDSLRNLALTRYRMAILNQIWRAEKDGVYLKAGEHFAFRDYVELLAVVYPDQLKQACAQAGYDPDFIDVLRDHAKDSGLEIDPPIRRRPRETRKA